MEDGGGDGDWSDVTASRYVYATIIAEWFNGINPAVSIS